MYIKLDLSICNNIIKEYNNGLSRNKLSIKYGVAHRTITNIINRNGRDRIKPNSKYSVKEDYFELIDSEEKAYWLGFLYADGFVQEKNKSLITGILLKDLDHIEKFKNSIESNGTIKKATTNGNWYLYIYNKKFSQHLVDKGCVPNKTKKIEFPKINKSLVRHFIRGFFDGDGSITCTDKTIQMSICCAQMDFLNELVRKMYEISGINKDVKLYKNKSGLNIYVCALRNDLLNIYKMLYENSNLFLDRKKQIFDYMYNNHVEIYKLINKKNWERRKNKKLCI